MITTSKDGNNEIHPRWNLEKYKNHFLNNFGGSLQILLILKVWKYIYDTDDTLVRKLEEAWALIQLYKNNKKAKRE